MRRGRFYKAGGGEGGGGEIRAPRVARSGGLGCSCPGHGCVVDPCLWAGIGVYMFLRVGMFVGVCCQGFVTTTKSERLVASPGRRTGSACVEAVEFVSFVWGALGIACAGRSCGVGALGWLGGCGSTKLDVFAVLPASPPLSL